MKAAKVPRLAWVSRDGRIIILARSVRTFAQGFIAVILAVYLAELGLSLVQLGAFFSVGVAGAAVFAILVGLTAEKVGRRRFLVLLTLVAGVAGVAIALTDVFPLLLVFAFSGNFTGAGGGAGTQPTMPLEQASLADASEPHRRTDLFAVYRIASTVAAALGALAAGLPNVYQGLFGVSQLVAFQSMFFTFGALLAVAAGLYALLSSAVEVAPGRGGWTNPLTLPSRRTIFTLTGLFSVDHLAGSFVIQSLVAYWFNTRFGLELGSLALLFFFSQVLSAGSLWASAKLANRIGMIRTMVYTHVPASLLLLAAAFAPNVWLAVLFWQLRSVLAQMDVPPRDSYTMAIVGPEERVAMASVHIVGRSVAGTVGPSLGTFMWQAISASAPFVAGAMLKLTYDAALFVLFRNVKPAHEGASLQEPRSETGETEEPSTRARP